MRAFFLLTGLFMWMAVGTLSAASEGEETATKDFDVTDMIMHHIGDSYVFHIVSFRNGKGELVDVSLPLPVIVWQEGHLKVFLSSRFSGGNDLVPIGNDHLRLYHEKIYLTDAAGTLHFGADHEVLNPRPLDLSITKNVVSMLLAGFLLALLMIGVGRSYSRRGGLAVPKGVQLVVEPVVLYVRDDIVKAQIDHDKADRFMPYLLSVFFFIWFNNMLGLIPFFPGGPTCRATSPLPSPWPSLLFWPPIFLARGTTGRKFCGRRAFPSM